MPLPAILPVPVDGDVPVRSADDVVALLPETHRRQESAPVRAALAEATADMFRAYQIASSYAAAQSDPTRATGQYLGAFAVGVKVFPQKDEGDEALRARLFAAREVVTPSAILDAANAILAPYTDGAAQLAESILDRWFVFDDTGPLTDCHSFVTDDTVSIWPEYPDRHYDTRPGRSPTAAIMFDDDVGRMFVLRVPDIGSAVNSVATATDGTDSGEFAGLYIDDGSDPTSQGQSFLFLGFEAAVAVYQRIANTVNTIAGHGVRWVLCVDPKLS